MCVEFDDLPYAVPLETHYTRNNILVMTYSLALFKVTELRHGEHVSSRGFAYPMRRSVYDPNARINHHGNGLHFAATPKNAQQLKGSYGSHRLVVMPATEVWDPVEKVWGKNAAGIVPVATQFCALIVIALSLISLRLPISGRISRFVPGSPRMPSASPLVRYGTGRSSGMLLSNYENQVATHCA